MVSGADPEPEQNHSFSPAAATCLQEAVETPARQTGNQKAVEANGIRKIDVRAFTWNDLSN